MTMSFASRAAAQKLGLIIAVLLIPALFFGGAFVRQALQDTASLQREIYGVALAELVFPALEGNGIDAIKSEKVRIDELETLLGMSGADRFSSYVQNKKHKDVSATKGHGFEVGQVYGYIADLASISGVILDGDGESYHLANMLLVTLPVVWNDAAAFEKKFEETTPHFSTRAKLSATVGNLDGAFVRQKDSLQRAKESADRPEKYSMLVAVDEKLEENIETLSAVVTGSEPVLNPTLIKGLTSGIRRLSQAMVTPAFSMLKNRLQARKQRLDHMLYLMLAVGAATALFATYLAARLISTTFKKLDAVEEAHRVSEIMRQETDRVNNDVADLNRTLADSLQKLQDAQDELLNKNKMEQLGQLTATVAHEIRNPLGSVRTSAFLISRKIDVKTAGIEVQLDRINKGVDRCDSIITQLLDFSRTKQITTQPSRFDDWLEGVVREEGATLPRAISIECHLGLEELDVNFDKARMRRAIINLMNNAAEAMVGTADQTKQFEGRSPAIRIETRRARDKVEIVVGDNGPGITAEVLLKIREPLFTTKNFGTGLGIPAVEQIVKQHGGELLINSTAGQGATFIISIPISNAGREAA